jgi:hypothetical protein
MRIALTICTVLLALLANAQTLPQQWATKIVDPIFTTTRVLGPTGGDFYQCVTGDACFAAMQQAYCDWAFDGVDDNWLIKVEHGTLIQTGASHTLPSPCPGATAYQSLTILPKIVSGALPTKVIVFDSDTPLPQGQTVCSHGTDDTGTRQPPSGDISTWWTGTNYGCANDIGSMWTLEGNWPSPGNTAMLIQSGGWDVTTNLGPAGLVIKNANFRVVKTNTAATFLVSAGSTNVATQISQFASNWHLENIYFTGNGTDWCNAVGGITQYSINSGGTGYVKNDTGTINTGSGTATYSASTVSGGVVSLVTLTNAGSGYSVGNNVATTDGGAQPGVGTGLSINILATAASSPSCVTSFNAGGPSTTHIVTAIKLADCSNCSLKYSYGDYFAYPGGGESHAVGIARGTGPVAIVHNWLSGASMPLLTGGISGTDPFYYLQNLEVRGNRFTNPPTLVGSGYLGPNLTLKAGFELKVGQYVVIDGNVAELIDESGQQNGECYELNPRPCSAGLQCDNPQTVLQEITETNNICRHSLVGFDISGRSGYPTNGGGVAPALRDVNITNNVIYDQGNSNLYDHFNLLSHPYPVRLASAGQVFICNGTRSGSQITLTCLQGPVGLSQTQIVQGDYFTVQGCSDSTWNLPTSISGFSTGPVAQAGTVPGGLTVVYNNTSAVASTATNCVITNFIGNPHNVNFSHNTMIMDTTAAGANNGFIYDGVFPVAPYSDTACAGGPQHTTTITSLSRSGGIVTAALTSLTGWATLNNAGSLIVEVSGVTPSDFNGTFYYLGTSGGNVTWQQAGATENGTAFGTVAQMGRCNANIVAQGSTFKNNLVAVNTPTTGWAGWISQGGTNAEGCANGFNAIGCSELIFDSVSSVATYTDFPGRLNTKYTEMGGVNAGAHPPITLTFPAATVCPGAAADATCVGLHDMMNGVAFDGNNANFQNYVLDSTSVYHNAADDGTDYGANPATIQSAINSLLYTCATSCGSGPLLDAGFSFNLTVTGNGIVQDSLSQISCPGTCTTAYPPGTVVVLTESPNAGNIFSGWGGACAGTATTCSLTINSLTTVTATFSMLSTTSGVTIDTGIKIDGTGGVKIVP